MFNDILNDIWNNYRGRLLCSVFGLFIGVVVLSARSWIRKRICWSGWIDYSLRVITDNGGSGKR